MKRILVLCAVMALSGCATSNHTRVGASNLSVTDLATAAQLVPVSATAPEGSQEVGPVQAARCHRHAGGDVPTESMVENDLQAEAYKIGANAIADVQITKETGFMQNCWLLLSGKAVAYKTAGSPPSEIDAKKEFDAQDKVWVSQLDSGEITLLQYARNVQALAKKLAPDASNTHAFNAYRVYAAKQLQDKKMSVEEYEYKVAEKYAEQKGLAERNYAAANPPQPQVIVQQPDPTPLMLYAIGSAFSNAYRQPARLTTNCTSSSLGGVVSTSCY